MLLMQRPHADGIASGIASNATDANSPAFCSISVIEFRNEHTDAQGSGAGKRRSLRHGCRSIVRLSPTVRHRLSTLRRFRSALPKKPRCEAPGKPESGIARKATPACTRLRPTDGQEIAARGSSGAADDGSLLRWSDAAVRSAGLPEPICVTPSHVDACVTAPEQFADLAAPACAERQGISPAA